jgi:hypothetical protein
MDDHTKYVHKYLWKINVPLKIRVFMWFLHKKVLLTKDNLIRRKWQGNKKCCFCDYKETVQHLFIRISFSQNGVACYAHGFCYNTTNKYKKSFGNWLVGVSKHERAYIRVGACALVWAIWKVRNDYIFNNAKSTSFMQVIPLASHWIRMWSCLQPPEK